MGTGEIMHIKRFVFSTAIDTDIYRPLSKEEFFDRLDAARRHADDGKVKEAHVVAENVRKKYGLA